MVYAITKLCLFIALILGLYSFYVSIINFLSSWSGGITIKFWRCTFYKLVWWKQDNSTLLYFPLKADNKVQESRHGL